MESSLPACGSAAASQGGGQQPMTKGLTPKHHGRILRTLRPLERSHLQTSAMLKAKGVRRAQWGCSPWGSWYGWGRGRGCGGLMRGGCECFSSACEGREAQPSLHFRKWCAETRLRRMISMFVAIHAKGLDRNRRLIHIRSDLSDYGVQRNFRSNTSNVYVQFP